MLIDAMNPLISAVSGLAGVLLGGLIAQHRQRVERRQALIREQLSEFYAPMLGYREGLKARGQLRFKIREAAQSEWQRLVEGTSAIDADARHELHEKRWPEFQRVIDHDNEQLEDVDIPTYRQMLDLFARKMHLAEPSTRDHFPALVEFIQIWERFLKKSLPNEVVIRIPANEENLKPL